LRIGRRRRHWAADLVARIAVFEDRRPARHDLGKRADDLLRPLALQHLQQVGVAVEMVEHLEQP